VRVGLGEGGAARPVLEILQRAPPGLHLVIRLLRGVGHELAAVVIELHRARAVHLVADEARRAVDQVGAASKSIFEVALMALRDGNAVGHDDHSLHLRWTLALRGASDARAVLSAGADGS